MHERNTMWDHLSTNPILDFERAWFALYRARREQPLNEIGVNMKSIHIILLGIIMLSISFAGVIYYNYTEILTYFIGFNWQYVLSTTCLLRWLNEIFKVVLAGLGLGGIYLIVYGTLRKILL